MTDRSPTRALSLVALLAAGCSSSAFESSLPGDRAVDGLSDAEARTLCEEVVAFTQDETAVFARDAECTSAAIRMAPLNLPDASIQAQRAECRRLREVCLAEAAPPLPSPAEACADVEPSETCTFTVRDVEICVGDLAAVVDRFNRQFSCSQVGVEELPDAPTVPPGCADVAEACTGFVPEVGTGDE
ncbi:MAG: hypothetical protein ACFCGT_02705 [Sandaracinaceae bacterium]